MNARVRVLPRVAGIVGLTHIGFGFLLGPLGWWMAWRLTPSALEAPAVREEIERALKDMPEASREDHGRFDVAELSGIVTTRSFRVLVCSEALLGVGFNVGVAYLSWRFARGALIGVRPFVILMAGCATYLYVVPRLVVWESPFGSAVAAAWGVGNMGLAPFFLTYFWLWGPILVVVGTRANGKA
jgi:hypothetical protein